MKITSDSFSFGGDLDWRLYSPNQPGVNGVIVFPVTGWEWWSLVTMRWRWFPAVGGSAAYINIFQGTNLVHEGIGSALATIAVESDISASIGSPIGSPLNQIGVISLPQVPVRGDGSIQVQANIANVADVLSLTSVVLCGRLL